MATTTRTSFFLNVHATTEDIAAMAAAREWFPLLLPPGYLKADVITVTDVVREALVASLYVERWETCNDREGNAIPWLYRPVISYWNELCEPKPLRPDHFSRLCEMVTGGELDQQHSVLRHEARMHTIEKGHQALEGDEHAYWAMLQHGASQSRLLRRCPQWIEALQRLSTL